MKYQEQHEAFKKLTIQKGICQREQVDEAMIFGCSVPPTKLDKWLNHLLEIPTQFCSQRRYVNRFKLGADPEFIFVKAGERMDARNLKLQQGLAFGMDNNGRLTEIRPYPSRSALEVTASILTTLRWMTFFHPETLGYEWWAGAFLLGDGLGGHVHFGRKRPGRDLEVQALDCLEEELLAIKAYPKNEVMRRRQGDGRNHPYGLPGDIRKQIHGYEYRTFPSWLDSPELAFLTITLSKLVVQNPTLTQGYVPLRTDLHYQRIKNLLAYYKDVDDDARLALLMVARKFPAHVGGDFKTRWGITNTFGCGNAVQICPSTIRPLDKNINELFNHLSLGTALGMPGLIPTWEPTVTPEGYEMLIDSVVTYGAKGLGELVHDVCTYKGMPYPITNSRDYLPDVFFAIPRKLADTLPLGWKKFCGDKIVVHNHDNYIRSAEKARNPETFSECRRLLLETILPFWRVETVKADSYQQWQSTLKAKPSKPKFAGTMLFGDATLLPIKF